MIDLGISERLNKIFRGKEATTGHNDLFYKNVSNKKAMVFPLGEGVKRSSDEPKDTLSKAYKDASGYKPTALSANSGGSNNSKKIANEKSKQNDAQKKAENAAKKVREEQEAAERAAEEEREAKEKAIRDSLGLGWDDSKGVREATEGSLASSESYINNLGQVKEQYLKSLDNYKAKNDEAIAGNKTLIERNQGQDLDSLAEDVRKNVDNTNVMLGVKGASGGSASKAAARAIARMAGKERSKTLTAYGDETSKQNQAMKNVSEDYTTRQGQADEWERTERENAMIEFNEQKAALDQLKAGEGGWREEDIKIMSDRNLNNFLGSLKSIQDKSLAFRDKLSAKMTEYGGQADELDTTAVDIDAPAELDTPEFDENIDMTNPDNTEDWYDPTGTGQRVIKGYDAMGNPIYEDGAVA